MVVYSAGQHHGCAQRGKGRYTSMLNSPNTSAHYARLDYYIMQTVMPKHRVVLHGGSQVTTHKIFFCGSIAHGAHAAHTMSLLLYYASGHMGCATALFYFKLTELGNVSQPSRGLRELNWAMGPVELQQLLYTQMSYIYIVCGSWSSLDAQNVPVISKFHSPSLQDYALWWQGLDWSTPVDLKSTLNQGYPFLRLTRP